MPVAPESRAVLRRPSGLIVALSTICDSCSGAPILAPVMASQTRAVLSAEAVTTRWPSALNAADRIVPVWRIGRPTVVPVRRSHTRAVLSEEDVSARVPLGLNTAELTKAR